MKIRQGLALKKLHCIKYYERQHFGSRVCWEEKTGIFQAKGERLGVVTIVRGLHCAAYTDAEKKTRKAGTRVQG